MTGSVIHHSIQTCGSLTLPLSLHASHNRLQHFYNPLREMPRVLCWKDWKESCPTLFVFLLKQRHFLTLLFVCPFSFHRNSLTNFILVLNCHLFSRLLAKLYVIKLTLHSFSLLPFLMQTLSQQKCPSSSRKQICWTCVIICTSVSTSENVYMASPPPRTYQSSSCKRATSSLSFIFTLGSQLEHRAPFEVSVITHTIRHTR
jgi:hypothetical protein